jgi:outer membrane protein assembly factor BamE
MIATVFPTVANACTMFMRLLIPASLMLSLLTGCSWLTPYTLDIHQGNIVTQEMVDQLKPGMTQRQVAFILGTPLLNDPFHDARWDYIYSTQASGGERVQRNLTVLFEQGELAGMQGDYRPGDRPDVDVSRDVTVSIPKIQREKSLWEKLRGLLGADD